MKCKILTLIQGARNQNQEYSLDRKNSSFVILYFVYILPEFTAFINKCEHTVRQMEIKQNNTLLSNSLGRSGKLNQQ